VVKEKTKKPKEPRDANPDNGSESLRVKRAIDSFLN
jgi:hypothetical protein